MTGALSLVNCCKAKLTYLQIPLLCISQPQISLCIEMEHPHRRKVGIPVDGSENSKKAVRWFLDNVADPTDLVIFIHAQELPDLPLFNIKSGFNIPTEQWMKTISDRYVLLDS